MHDKDERTALTFQVGFMGHSAALIIGLLMGIIPHILNIDTGCTLYSFSITLFSGYVQQGVGFTRVRASPLILKENTGCMSSRFSSTVLPSSSLSSSASSSGVSTATSYTWSQRQEKPHRRALVQGVSLSALI